MIDFAEKTVKELRECAKKLNLPGVSKLKKDGDTNYRHLRRPTNAGGGKAGAEAGFPGLSI